MNDATASCAAKATQSELEGQAAWVAAFGVAGSAVVLQVGDGSVGSVDVSTAPLPNAAHSEVLAQATEATPVSG